MKWEPRWFGDLTSLALVFHRVDWKRQRTLCGLPTTRFAHDAEGRRYWDRELGHIMQRERAELIGRACQKCEASPRAGGNPPWN